MKTRISRSTIRTATLLGAGLIVSLGSYLHMQQRKSRADETVRNLRECEALALQIAQLQSRPVLADLHSRTASDMAQKVELAAEEARLPPGNIVRIDPGEPRRIGESDYKQQPTDVELRPVTLQQLVKFLDVVSKDAEANVGFVWLTSPASDQANRPGRPENWNAQLILTNLIFAPKGE